jgi:hypothetical protein
MEYAALATVYNRLAATGSNNETRDILTEAFAHADADYLTSSLRGRPTARVGGATGSAGSISARTAPVTTSSSKSVDSRPATPTRRLIEGC